MVPLAISFNIMLRFNFPKLPHKLSKWMFQWNICLFEDIYILLINIYILLSIFRVLKFIQNAENFALLKWLYYEKFPFLFFPFPVFLVICKPYSQCQRINWGIYFIFHLFLKYKFIYTGCEIYFKCIFLNKSILIMWNIKLIKIICRLIFYWIYFINPNRFFQKHFITAVAKCEY